MTLSYETIAKKIDHALLTPTMTRAEMSAGCELARVYDVASVCIKPYAVPLAVAILEGSTVKVGTVIGFPHGGQSLATKLEETHEAFANGATEVDVVINIGVAIEEDWNYVEREIETLTQIARTEQAVIKVILETCYLNDNQKIRICQICNKIQVDYVKTSTGFGTNGATIDDLTLMKRQIVDPVRLKASGGIKDLNTAIRYVELGAQRLGLSRTAEILNELSDRLSLPRRGVSRETSSQSENY